MIVKRIGTVKEFMDGTLDIRHWVVDDCNLHTMTKDEERELIDLAKGNGSYSMSTFSTARAQVGVWASFLQQQTLIPIPIKPTTSDMC